MSMKSTVLRKVIAVSMAVAMVTGTALCAPVISDFAGTSITVSAAETYGDFEYTVADDNTVTVTKYTGTNAKVTVPEKINSKTVTAIGSYAFCENTGITGVTLPKTLKAIKSHAFYGCSNLASINIPSTVESIGEYAFYGCSKMTSFSYPVSLKSAGSYIFQNTPVKTVTVPEEVTEIPSYLFKNANMLEKVVLPDTVTKIGNYAFENCVKLTSINLPDTVETIEEGAFYNCGLTSINFPKKLKNAGSYVFKNTPIKTIKVKEGVTALPNNAFNNANKLESVVLPTTLKTIGNYSFYECTSLKSVTIPEETESIGEGAFQNCSAMTKVVMNDSLKTIKNDAFHGCSVLASIEVPDTVTSMGSYAFANCKKLTTFNYPKKLTYSGSNVFKNVPVKTITLKSSVTELPENAFYGANLLEKVVLPSGLKKIGSEAFRDCTSLTSVNVPDAVESIGSYAFCNCVKLTSINYPKNLKSSGSNVFKNTGIKTITVKDGVTAVPDDAFYHADNLEKVVLPSSLKKIGSEAFRECYSLTSVNVPDSVESIGSYAFCSCEKLTSFNYPKNLKSSGSSVFKNAGIKTITVKEGVTDVWGDAFNNANNLEKVVLPSTLKSIGTYAFNDCYSLKSINIPDSVEKIGGYAFDDCTSLTSINYPSSLTSIGGYAFSDVPLSCVTVKEGVTVLPSDTFHGANKIQKVSLPSTLKKIGSYAFQGCSSLEILKVGANIENIDNYSFSGCEKLTIYGKAGTYTSTYAESKGIPYVTEFSNLSIIAPVDKVSDTQNFTVMADASGGKTPYTYAVYYKLASEEKWTTLKDFNSTANTAFNPPYMGDYDICVKVKDAGGTVKPKYFTVSAERILKNKSTLSDKEILFGESFTVNAKATGGYGGYKYAILYKKSSSSEWTTKQDYSTNTKLDIKPAGTGTYNVCIKAKDADGEIVKTTLNIKVNKPLANVSTISSEEIYLGNSVTVTGKATGGIGAYTYSFLYKKKSDTKWTTKQDFKANSAVDIKPASATDYDICVKIKDGRGTVEKKFFTVKVSASAPLANTGTISTTSIKLGETVTLKGSATGGKTPYTYAFLYKKTSDTKWTTKQDFKANATVDIKPAVATTYDMCIKVKDAGGTVEKKFFKVTVTKPLTNDSTISATSIKKGSTVTVKCTASGGAGGYTYAVLYKKKSDTKWTVKQNYSANTSVSVKPYLATDYEICVKTKDKDGTIAKKFFAVKVSAT